MLKKIIIHLLIGGAIWLLGALLHDFGNMQDLGNFLAYSGVVYAILSVPIIFFKWKGIAVINNALTAKERNNATNELLNYKKLLDKGILSQSEFDKKSEELKRKIL